MRLLMALHGPADARTGGTGVVVGALAAGLRALGHTVGVLGPGGDVTVPQVPAVGLRQAWSRDGARWLLRRRVLKWQPDLIHVHHSTGLPLSMGALFPRIPLVHTFHDYSLPCMRGQLVDRWGRPCVGPSGERCAACLAPRLGAKRPQSRGHQLTERLVAARAEVRRASARLAPSRHLAARMGALGFGPVLHVPLPLCVPIQPAPPPGQGPVRFLFLGSVLPTKGVELLVRAFAELPKNAAQLTIVGDAPRWADDPSWVDRLKGERGLQDGVTWRPGVAHSALQDVFDHHDVLVLPSVWHENSPLTVREATAAGLRTILPKEGGARELDPDAGLCENGDLEGLFRALLAEVTAGRARRSPLHWPSPQDHAADLIARVYTPALVATGARQRPIRSQI